MVGHNRDRQGYREYGESNSDFILPYCETLECYSGGGDYVVSEADDATYWGNCRFVSVDVSGIVKFDFKNQKGDTGTEVKVLTAGVLYDIANVVRVYEMYNAQTECTTEILRQTTGTTGVGLKLHR